MNRKVPGGAQKVTLRRWRVVEVVMPDGACNRHVWGHDVTHNMGRASSAIREFDADGMTATTRSGRNYKLQGLPGNSRLGEHAWIKWCNDNGVVSKQDVTHEYFNVDRLSTLEIAKISTLMGD
jgi:hypothetical protein